MYMLQFEWDSHVCVISLCPNHNYPSCTCCTPSETGVFITVQALWLVSRIKDSVLVNKFDVPDFFIRPFSMSLSSFTEFYVPDFISFIFFRFI